MTKKELILKDINSNPSLARKALETIYCNRTYAIYKDLGDNARIDTFYKTKRGAEGYIKRQGYISWYDDYSQEMVNAGSGLENIEIHAGEIADPSTNKKMWYLYLKEVWSKNWLLDNALNEAKNMVTDTELLKWIEETIKDIKETDSFLWIEEFEYMEEVKAIHEDVKELEEIPEAPEVEENNNINIEISFNEEKNGIEIKFDDKPERAILENLKANGFRWSKYQKIWYAKDTEERREFIKQFEGVEVTAKDETIFEYPEIDIDDLDYYTVDSDLSKRENESSWIFRSRERDHNQELRNTLEYYQNQAIEIIGLTDDKETIYYIKRDLQRFKKAYHSNYIAILTNKAKNPSWAVTGRAGRNARRDQKAIDRWDRLIQKSIDIVKELEKNLERHESRIRTNTRKKLYRNIENTDIEIDFKVETKEIEYLNVKQKVRTYNYKNYMIAKLWGCFRILKDGKELPKEIIDLRTTDTLTTAKKGLQLIINKEKKELQKAI